MARPRPLTHYQDIPFFTASLTRWLIVRTILAGLGGLILGAGMLMAQAPTHPLDGLSGREHWVIYDALVASGRTDSTTNYLYVGLNEPPKAEVLAWRSGQPFRREALVHLIQGGHGYEAIVDLAGKKVLSWTEVPNRQYMTSTVEDNRVNELAILIPLRARVSQEIRNLFFRPRALDTRRKVVHVSR